VSWPKCAMHAATSTVRAFVVISLCVAPTNAYDAALCARASHSRACVSMMAKKEWTKSKTLGETVGASNGNFKETGLIGSVAVEFTQAGESKVTMALPGQGLSQVAIQAGQIIKYQCRKGECGTCEVTINGEKVRTCMAKVPTNLPEGENYVVEVPIGKVRVKKQSAFFSIRSFLDGFKNNVKGFIGFVTYGRKEKQNFKDRINAEEELKKKVLAKKLAKALPLELEKKKVQ